MWLTVLGSGASVARPGAANSGYLVESARARVLVDCGAGVAARLLGATDPAALDAIIISHTHADHCVETAHGRDSGRRVDRIAYVDGHGPVAHRRRHGLIGFGGHDDLGPQLAGGIEEVGGPIRGRGQHQ